MGGYTSIVRFFLRKLKNDHVGAYAGQATLFIIMSVIPFLLILTYFLRFTPITEATIVTGINLLMPSGVPDMVVTIIEEVYQNSGKLLIPALIIAIFSSAKAVQSLRYGLNIVYDIEETRNWFMLRFRAMLETFLMILILFVLMLLLVFGKNIHEVLTEHAPIVAVVTNIILKLRIAIIFVILIPFFCFIYKFLPNRNCTFKSQLVGAVGCAMAWYVFTFFLFIYIYFFKGFSLYGSFTILLLFMFWMYICMYIFLVCGAVNSMFEVLWKELKETRARNKLAKMQEEGNIDSESSLEIDQPAAQDDKIQAQPVKRRTMAEIVRDMDQAQSKR